MQMHARRRVTSVRGGVALLIALFTALAVMIAPLAAKAAPVGDAENPAITITSDEGDHTYGAYQIFSGRAEGDSLVSIEWANGVNKDQLLTDLAAAFTEVTGEENAAQLAAKLSTLDAVKLSKIVAKNVQGDPVTFTKTGEKAPFTYTAQTVEQGYYVIVDTNIQEASAVTSPILKVVGPVSVESKSSVPTHDKQVKENDTKRQGLEGTWDDQGLGEVADYNIGDDVPFVLHGTLPSNYADFDTYKYGFIDTLSKAFDDPQNIKVYVDGVEVPEANYTIDGPNPVDASETGHYAGGKTFSVNFADLKTAAPAATKDSKIRVEYTAKLNSNAVIDNKGNGNKSKVYYQKSTAEGSGEETPGETPWDNTWVFTYTVESSKHDAMSQEELSGAKFVLQRYILNEDGLPTEDVEFAVLDANQKIEKWVKTQDEATEVESKAGEKFAFKGLDKGYYALVETEAPEGYKLSEKPFEFSIYAEMKEEGDVAELTELILSATSFALPNDLKAVNGNLETATMTMSIPNTSSSDLPSTGGMGTVLFTAGGLALMALAGFGIVSRNRKRAEA